jgi:5-methylcytosine-specific restriction enzyme subunit McrC
MPDALLTAFEHDTVLLRHHPQLTPAHLDALDHLQQRHQARWFTRIHQGLRLHQFVGILQVAGLTLEILPKAERHTAPDTPQRWRKVLFQLLRVVHDLPVAVPDVAQLAQSPQALLDLFVAAFVQEADALLRQGLARHYHPTDANRPALRGQLLFAQQIQHNSIRRDRFFTRQQTYDAAHPFNCLLRMALALATRQVSSAALAARARTLLLHWPELPPVPVPPELPPLGRHTERYRRAMELALLLLHTQSPTLASGPTQALALLFDMNRLFERYIARRLHQAGARVGSHVQLQASRRLWGRSTLKPDLLVTIPTDSGAVLFVLDTKWKVPAHATPKAEDLRQLYTYCHLWQANHGLLIYPHTAASPATIARTFTPSQFAPQIVLQGHSYHARLLTPAGDLNPKLGAELLNYLKSSLTA